MIGVYRLAGKIVSLDGVEAHAPIGGEAEVQECIRALRSVLIGQKEAASTVAGGKNRTHKNAVVFEILISDPLF